MGAQNCLSFSHLCGKLTLLLYTHCLFPRDGGGGGGGRKGDTVGGGPLQYGGPGDLELSLLSRDAADTTGQGVLLYGVVACILTRESYI